MRSAPQSLLLAAISLIKAIDAARKPWFSCARLRFASPEQAEELTMPAQQRLWLEKVECLFPGPNHFGQEYQEKPVRLFVYRSFDLSMEDGELLS
jgi:hypothetical protein